MSESNYFQNYALMCMRLAAECRSLAADAPELDLSAHFLHMASMWTELADQPRCPALTDDTQADAGIKIQTDALGREA